MFVATAVSCGPRSTNLLTEGGFVYTYGVIGSHRAVRRDKATSGPYGMPDFGQHFICSLQASANFNAVLNDRGEVYVYDS